jgi:hypothetical protein
MARRVGPEWFAVAGGERLLWAANLGAKRESLRPEPIMR